MGKFAVQADFARALGIDKSLLSNYETGKTRPSDEAAARIADVLGIDVLVVRRRLGLWVPPDKAAELDAGPNEESLAERARRILAMAQELAADAERREREQAEDERRHA